MFVFWHIYSLRHRVSGSVDNIENNFILLIARAKRNMVIFAKVSVSCMHRLFGQHFFLQGGFGIL